MSAVNPAPRHPPAGAPPEQFEARSFDLDEVVGLSKYALDTHLSLYEGYVKETNALLARLNEMAQSQEVSANQQLQFDGLVRRFAFERNGMVLHELFFDALGGGGAKPPQSGVFMEAVDTSFGGFDGWKRDVVRLSHTRGVGWVLTFRAPANNRLSNVWVDDHRRGLLAGMRPIAAFDFWEHAYMFDFKSSERAKYLEVLFDNYRWDVVEARCR